MEAISDPQALINGFGQLGYVLDEDLAALFFLQLRLQRPMLIEGHAGVGKTESARAMADFLGTRLIRLQCYEGLDIHNAVYEWNYPKQLLALKIRENESDKQAKEAAIFSEDYLLARPLLQAIQEQEQPPVLLIDEIDRGDEELEAFLLELLSAYQITIPELGTIRAQHKPHVILTSNRTRELSDALKRRCLYHWIDFPDVARELAIVRKHLPEIQQQLASHLVAFIQHLREMQLSKTPGIAETLDWATALMALGAEDLDQALVNQTLGCILKTNEDMENLRKQGIGSLLTRILSN